MRQADLPTTPFRGKSFWKTPLNIQHNWIRLRHFEHFCWGEQDVLSRLQAVKQNVWVALISNPKPRTWAEANFIPQRGRGFSLKKDGVLPITTCSLTRDALLEELCGISAPPDFLALQKRNAFDVGPSSLAVWLIEQSTLEDFAFET